MRLQALHAAEISCRRAVSLGGSAGDAMDNLREVLAKMNKDSPLRDGDGTSASPAGTTVREAIGLAESGQLEEAVQLFEKIAKDEESPEAWSNLCVTQMRLQDLHAAEFSCRRAVSLGGSAGDAMDNLREVLAKMKKDAPILNGDGTLVSPAHAFCPIDPVGRAACALEHLERSEIELRERWAKSLQLLRSDPNATVLSGYPHIVTIEGFLTVEECAELSRLYDIESQKIMQLAERRGTTKWCFWRWTHNEDDPEGNDRAVRWLFDLRARGVVQFDDAELLHEHNAVCLSASGYNKLRDALPYSSSMSLRGAHFHGHDLLQRLSARLEERLGLSSSSSGAKPQLLHYSGAGASYEAHTDCRIHRQSLDDDRMIDGQPNDRVVSFLAYLEDAADGDGGETEFTQLGIQVRPRRGRALVWMNLDFEAPYHAFEGPRCIEQSEHRSAPIHAGKKRVLQQWFHFRDSPSRTFTQVGSVRTICDSSGSCREYMNM